MPRSKATLYIDDDIRAATKLAAVAGRKSESDVVEEALRQYLRTDDAERGRESLRELMDRVAARNSDLSDEEAMQLANDELHAVRAERRQRQAS